MEKEQKAKGIIEVSELLEILVSQPAMIELQQTDNEEYKRQMMEIAPDFASRFPTIFQLILERKDITMARIVLTGHIDNARGKISNDQLEERLGKKLADSMYEFK